MHGPKVSFALGQLLSFRTRGRPIDYDFGPTAAVRAIFVGTVWGMESYITFVQATDNELPGASSNGQLVHNYEREQAYGFRKNGILDSGGRVGFVRH